MSVEYGVWTLGVVVVVGAVTLIVGWWRPFIMLSALILLVPFRDFSTRWMNVHTDLTVSQVTAIGRWWFVIILALLALVGGKWAYSVWRQWPDLKVAWVDLLLGMVLLLGLWSTLTSPEPRAAVTSFRGYVQPLGVYVLARLIRPSRRELRALLVLWLAVGLIMAGFGLWQTTLWSEADYRAEGYVRQNGDLVVPYVDVRGQRYLRPASTVSGPNELGLDMVILFLLALMWIPWVARRQRGLLAGLVLMFTAGLAVSVSRSAFVAYVISLGAVAGLSWASLRSWAGSLSRKARSRALLAVATGVVGVAVILLSTGMMSLVSRTISSLTGQYHYVDSIEAVAFLMRQPQGVGMGLVEPKGALLLINAEGAYHVEGSIFQIAMEMGVWGLAAWLAFWGVALAMIWRNWRAVKAAELRVVTSAGFAGWLGGLAAFLFLPLMQSISLMVWLWFLLGIGVEAGAIEAEWSQARAAPSVQGPD